MRESLTSNNLDFNMLLIMPGPFDVATGSEITHSLHINSSPERLFYADCLTTVVPVAVFFPSMSALFY